MSKTQSGYRIQMLTLGRRTYEQIHTPTIVRGGEGVDGTPPQIFVQIKAQRNYFAMSRKPVDNSIR